VGNAHRIEVGIAHPTIFNAFINRIYYQTVTEQGAGVAEDSGFIKPHENFTKLTNISKFK
jgi:hypothetical protein